MNDDPIEKLEELRNVINSSILCKQNAWNKKGDGNWNKLWSAFDNIEDAQLAINEYDFHKNSRVFIFGVLQALVIQQDAIKHLSEAVGLKSLNFKKDSKLGKIREVRIETIGHPSQTTKDRKKSSYKDGTITYTSLYPTEKKFEYTVWSNNGPVRKEIKIEELIKDQGAELCKEIDKILKQIKEIDLRHIKKFKGKSLFSELSQTVYLVGKLYPFEHSRIHSKVCFDILSETYNRFKTDIRKRYEISDFKEYGVQVPGLIYEIQKIDKLLPRIKKMVPMVGIDELDLEVYVESLEKSFSALIKMAKEIDEDFASKK